MMALFLMSGSFMVVFFLCLIYFVVHTDKRRRVDEELNRKRFEELADKINETHKLFKTDVSTILDSFKRILPNKDL